MGARTRSGRLWVHRKDGGRAGALASGFGVVLVLALFALTFGGRTVSAPPAPMAAALLLLPYLYGVVIGVLAVAWAVFRDRWLLAAGVVALVSVGAAMWGPRWSGQGVATEGAELRVMSWNLRRLWGGPDDGGDAKACAIAGISQQQPDVLTLLEVSKEDVEALSKALDLDCVQHSYSAEGGPRTGGLATCVRGDRWRLRSGSGLRYVDHADWYYVLSEVERGDQVFNLLAIHLSPYEYVAKKIRTSVEQLGRGEADPLVDLSREGEGVIKGQADQSAALLERVDKFRDPTVVAGDFNSTRDTALHAALRTKLSDTWEVGGAGFGGTVYLFDKLPLRIDYVYVTQQFHVRSTEVLPLGCSDHHPVVTDLILTTAPP